MLERDKLGRPQPGRGPEIAGMRVVIAGTVLNRLAGILDVDRLVAAEEVRLSEASLHRLHKGT